MTVIGHHVKQSTKNVMIKHTDQGKDQDQGIGDPLWGRDQDMGYGNPDQRMEDPNQRIKDTDPRDADPNQWKES